MTNQPLPAATPQKTGSLTFGLNRLSRDIGAALLTRAGGVMLATAAVLGLGALPLPAQAGGFQVSKLTDTADGTCDADCSLREAIAAANTSTGADTITFASSATGTITLDIATHGNIDITDELTITGPGADQLSVSGGDVAPGTEDGGIFNVTSAATVSTITGLTLTNGKSNEDGGAIFAYSNLVLDGVTIRDSHAGDGGGFYVLRRVVTVTNSTVSGNHALFNGGGLYIAENNATLTSIIVTGNGAGNDGGGIFLRSGEANIINSTVSGNTASDDGGGFEVDYGNANLTNSTVSNNTVYSEGGGFKIEQGNVTLTNSTVSGNAATEWDGGGFFLYDGDATLTNSSVRDNTANDDGGGFYLLYGNAELTDSTVSGNDAGDDGGGFEVDYGDATLTNSTVSGNTTYHDGGGFYMLDGNASLINSTVSGNTADSEGGGIFVNDGNTDLGNSVVAANTAAASPDAFLDSSFTFYADFSLIGAYNGTISGANNIVGTTAVPIDPLLGPLADNGGPTRTHTLGANSPALDAGSNTLAAGLDYDQRGPGYPRIISGTVDMGAFERSDLIFADGFE